MSKMVVIGLGSMGKRRIRLLKKINPEYEIIGIDARDDRKQDVEKLGSEMGTEIKTYSSVDEIDGKEDVEGVLVCTGPLAHASIINECLKRGFNVFSEINLVSDGYEDNITIAKDKELILYLSSTPMFRKEIKHITKCVGADSGKLNYIFHVGQYLPDWHPWENYKDSFFSNTRTNGCREILAIELPWLVRCFGEISNIDVSTAKQTELEIEFNDSYNLLITHKNGNRGVFVVDVVSRFPVRYFEVSGEKLFITWNGKPNGIKQYDFESKSLEELDLYDEVSHRDGYNTMIIEDAYEEELRDFLLVLEGRKNLEYSFEKDDEILKVIDEVERCRS